MIPLKDDNPTSTVPYVNTGIIALNVLVFVYSLTLGDGEVERFVNHYAAVPALLFGEPGPPVRVYSTLVTSMFLHGGFLHIAGNMLFLWIFGDNVEDALGHVKYVFFYLACGIIAALAHGLTDPGSKLPMLGASGAISGVLGAYMILYPRARVWTFFFFIFFWQVIKVPAVIIIGLWIIVQVLNGLTTYGQSTGGVAWFAHVGGFAAGIILILFMREKKKNPRFV